MIRSFYGKYLKNGRNAGSAVREGFFSTFGVTSIAVFATIFLLLASCSGLADNGNGSGDGSGSGDGKFADLADFQKVAMEQATTILNKVGLVIIGDHLKDGDASGTSFEIDVEGRKYTIAHVSSTPQTVANARVAGEHTNMKVSVTDPDGKSQELDLDVYEDGAWDADGECLLEDSKGNKETVHYDNTKMDKDGYITDGFVLVGDTQLEMDKMKMLQKVLMYLEEISGLFEIHTVQKPSLEETTSFRVTDGEGMDETFDPNAKTDDEFFRLIRRSSDYLYGKAYAVKNNKPLYKQSMKMSSNVKSMTGAAFTFALDYVTDQIISVDYSKLDVSKDGIDFDKIDLTLEMFLDPESEDYKTLTTAQQTAQSESDAELLKLVAAIEREWPKVNFIEVTHSTIFSTEGTFDGYTIKCKDLKEEVDLENEIFRWTGTFEVDGKLLELDNMPLKFVREQAAKDKAELNDKMTPPSQDEQV